MHCPVDDTTCSRGCEGRDYVFCGIRELHRQNAILNPDDPFPKPWRVEEDWTAEILAANGRCVTKLPLSYLGQAREIVAAANGSTK